MQLRYKAVLFDLDDTLFDHQFHRRRALQALKVAAGLPDHIGLGQLETAHEGHLQRTHVLLLAGKMSLDQARSERLRATLGDCGRQVHGDEMPAFELAYRSAYEQGWQAVPGAIALVDALREAGARIGVVTNGRAQDQYPKLDRISLRARVDFVVVSQEVGCEKPSREFFALAATRARADFHECVVVGDLWNTDIAGALGCGMGAVWLNRYERPSGRDARVAEIRSFTPLDSVLRHFSLN